MDSGHLGDSPTETAFPLIIKDLNAMKDPIGTRESKNNHDNNRKPHQVLNYFYTFGFIIY